MVEHDKHNLVRTLKRSYVLDVDYTVTREPNPIKRKYGSNNWSSVRVSPSCFKELAMRSNSKNSALVRMYMLQVEDAFIGYRTQTADARGDEEQRGGASGQPKTAPKTREAWICLHDPCQGRGFASQCQR